MTHMPQSRTMDEATTITVGRVELGLRAMRTADLDTVPEDALSCLQQLLLEASDLVEGALERADMTPEELAAWKVEQEESLRVIQEQLTQVLANRRGRS